MNRTLNLSLAACLLVILACLLSVDGRMGRGGGGPFRYLVVGSIENDLN